VENDAPQSPLPEQGGAKQQEYYGWQYDQDDATEVIQPRSAAPQPRVSSQPLPNAYNPPPSLSSSPPTSSKGAGAQNDVLYPDPLYDLGSSLGYGQGMESRYFDAPQPSQPIEMVRQERLQQLREERMRRQQRRMPADMTGYVARGKKAGLPFSRSPYTQSPEQMSPTPSSPVQPALSQTVVPAGVVPAAEPTQDTGMIQRARLGRATLILTIAFVASRILGLVQSTLFAFVFGTTIISDAYTQAFFVPDFMYNVVAGGALSSAFIPIFTKHIVTENDRRKAWHFASAALNLALAVMVVIALLVIIFAPQLVPLYNLGIHNPAELALIASLTRVLLLQSVILGVGVIVTSILNALQDFRLSAIGTVLYNFGLIAGLLPGLFFAFRGQRNDIAAAYSETAGVVVGAALLVGIQLTGLPKVGMKYSFTFDWRDPSVRQMGRQMIPRVVNAAMLYVSTFVDRNLIQLMAVVPAIGTLGVQGLITQYSQAFQLVLMPLGVFGMSVSTAAFPTLAENVAKGRMDRVRNTILEVLRSILFLSIPSSVGLIVLGLPIIQVLFQHGRYTLEEARSTAIPLACFAIGLAGLAAVEILTRSFYAMRDSKTPVIVSVAQFIFKIALSLVLINLSVFGAKWGMGALAFSTSVAGLLEAGVLYWILHQRVGGLQARVMCKFVGRVLLTSVIMGVGLIIVSFILDKILVTTHDQTLAIVGTGMAAVKLIIELFVGTFIYLRCARMLGIEEMGPVKRVLDRLKLSWI
jgi:putative peptidoglycan lipid II flippase